jgi:hypothetical protein
MSFHDFVWSQTSCCVVVSLSTISNSNSPEGVDTKAVCRTTILRIIYTVTQHSLCKLIGKTKTRSFFKKIGSASATVNMYISFLFGSVFALHCLHVAAYRLFSAWLHISTDDRCGIYHLQWGSWWKINLFWTCHNINKLGPLTLFSSSKRTTHFLSDWRQALFLIIFYARKFKYSLIICFKKWGTWGRTTVSPFFTISI